MWISVPADFRLFFLALFPALIGDSVHDREDDNEHKNDSEAKHHERRMVLNVFRDSEQHDAQTVPSPCMSVCQMDVSTGLCQGCFRTLEEIGLWGNADDAFKRVVWARIETRLTQFES